MKVPFEVLNLGGMGMRKVMGVFGLVGGLTVLPPDLFGIKPQSDGGQGSGGKHNKKRRQGLQRRGVGGHGYSSGCG